jgi:hypothetical protein
MNVLITSQTFTAAMHSAFRQKQEQQQEEHIRPETYLQIYNKATVLRWILYNDVERVR